MQDGGGEDKFPEDSLGVLKEGDNKQKKREQETPARFLCSLPSLFFLSGTTSTEESQLSMVPRGVY